MAKDDVKNTKKAAKTKDKSVLSQPLSLLDPKSLKDLGIPLGVPGRPLPAVDLADIEIDEEQNRINFSIKALVADKSIDPDAEPIYLYSERPYEKAVGKMYRELVVPSMLPIMMDGLRMRAPDSKRRAQSILGLPGFGKSHFAKSIAAMRSNKGVVEAQVGGRNADELMFETALDLDGNSDFYKELNNRLANGTAKPETITALREGLGEAFIESGNKRGIDLAKIGEAHGEEDTRNSYERMTEALEYIKQVSDIEGLGNMGGNSLGLRAQYGPIIKAWQNGQELLLDEYNKRRRGSGDSLQAFWQFMAGEINEVTVENPLKETSGGIGQSFTFRRKDMPIGFFVSLTGNSVSDSDSTQSGSRSFNSRIPGYMLNAPTLLDWQHRITQVWTGVPVSTLYFMSEAEWKNDPKRFTKFLRMIRTLGLSPEEINAIPKREFDMIENWDKIMEASSRLAQALSDMSDATNPESALFTDPNNSEIAASLYDEVDPDYYKRKGIDFRFIIQLHEKALAQNIEVVSPESSGGFEVEGWGKKPEIEGNILMTRDSSAADFGSRLIKTLTRELRSRTLMEDKWGLYKHLKERFNEAQVFTPENKEIESNITPFSDLLNVHSKGIEDANDLKDVQTLLANHLREKYPDMSTDNDDIIPLGDIKAALETMAGIDMNLKSQSNRNYITLSDADNWDMGPFKVITTQEEQYEKEGPQVADVVPKDILDINSFLAPLAVPNISERNLQSLWTKAFSELHENDTEMSEQDDISIGIIEGTHETGLALTTVIVNKEGKLSPIHILRDMEMEKTLLMGQAKTSTALQTAMKARKITYIDTSGDGGAARVQAGIDKVFKGRIAGQMEYDMIVAFLWRNSTGDEKRDDAAFDPKNHDIRLADFLAQQDIQVMVPHYVTKKEVMVKKADAKAKANAEEKSKPKNPAP